MAAADFGSGLVHWAADTWGRDDLPVIGRRLLVPFRVHHVNPDDFLRRRFVDTNGDVAFLAVPVLLGALRGSARHRLGRPGRRLRLRVLRDRHDDEPDSPVGAHAVAAARRSALLQDCGHPSGARRACGASRAAVRRALLHHHRMVQPAARGDRVLPAPRGRDHASHRRAAAARRPALRRAIRRAARRRAARPGMADPPARAPAQGAPLARDDRADGVRLRLHQRAALGDPRDRRLRRRARACASRST